MKKINFIQVATLLSTFLSTLLISLSSVPALAGELGTDQNSSSRWLCDRMANSLALQASGLARFNSLEYGNVVTLQRAVLAQNVKVVNAADVSSQWATGQTDLNYSVRVTGETGNHPALYEISLIKNANNQCIPKKLEWVTN